MPGQVKYPTQGKYVTGSGLTHSHWTINALQRAFSNVWEKERKEVQCTCKTANSGATVV